MSSENTAISVEGVSKVFHVYEKPADRLAQMFLPKVGRLVPGRGGSRWESLRFSKEFWALRDLSFEVKKGDSLGIIGRNGSGKSTLLQIIAGTLMPTTGSARVNGRVAALLELGSGFNPEFSGRENVILNGMILGLTQREILERFDDIAAFADIGEFLDVPIRNYSSGMQMRLGFSVAVHVEPEIILIDEVLAVGDYNFQLKCLDRISQMQEQGVTILFVAHDFERVQNLCKRAIWMESGTVQADGDVDDIVEAMKEKYYWDGHQVLVKNEEAPEVLGVPANG